MTATPTPGDLSARHVEVLRGVLETAVCPMKEHGCDGTQYPVGDPQGEYHGEQCQWCDERKQAIAALSALPAAGGAVAYGVRGGSGELWVCDFGLATIDKKNADEFIAWANEYRSADGPFAIVHFYTTPQPSAAEDAAVGAQGDGVHGHRTMDDFPVSTSIPVADLAAQLRQYADPNCRECDGSGVWMGNVLVCSCILDNIPAAPAAGKGVDAAMVERDLETVAATDLTLTDVWAYHRDRANAASLTPESCKQHARMARVLHAALTRQPVAGDGWIKPSDVVALLNYLAARLSYGPGELVHPDELPGVPGLPNVIWSATDAVEAEARRLIKAPCWTDQDREKLLNLRRWLNRGKKAAALWGAFVDDLIARSSHPLAGPFSTGLPAAPAATPTDGGEG